MTVRQLEKDSRTTIKLVGQNADINGGHGLFLITGPLENREKAEVLIQQILVGFEEAINIRYSVTFLVYWCSVLTLCNICLHASCLLVKSLE